MFAKDKEIYLVEILSLRKEKQITLDEKNGVK